MIVTRSHSVVSHVRARDLTSLMDVYECNYLRLRKLIPDASAIPGECTSRLASGMDLHLAILELAKYTTTLRLTYFFEEDGVCYPAPDVKVRIYHDAHLAEVVSCGRRRGRRAAEYDRVRHDYPLARKWEINRFLFKWLGYILHQGHSFAPDRVVAPDSKDMDKVLQIVHCRK